LGKILGSAGKTSIRASYGIFNTLIQGNTLAFDEPQPPYGLSYTSGVPPLFATPFIGTDGSVHVNPYPIIFPPLNGASASHPNSSIIYNNIFNPQAGMTAPPPWDTYPYTENYFFSIERQLVGNTVLSLSYVGSQAHHLLLTYSINPGNPALCLFLSDRNNLAPNSATCGPNGEDTTYITKSGQVINGTRGPFGSILGNDDFEGSFGNSSYNSLQATLRHSGKRYFFLIGYTYSKSIDQASALGETVNPFDYQATRAISAWDLKHDFVASYQVDLPFDLLTKKWSVLTKGWAISGITRATSGFPVTLKSFEDNSLQGSSPQGVNNYSLDTADYIGLPLNLNGNPRNGLPYFNPAAFTVSALGSPGNASRRSFYGPGSFNSDLALLKDFRLGEGRNLQFRMETFNTFNHTQFFGPAAVNGNIDSPLFGQVVKAAAPRLVQLALKLSF